MPPSFINDSIQTAYTDYAKAYNKPFIVGDFFEISEASGAWESGSGYSNDLEKEVSSPTNLVDQATLQNDFWSPILNSDFMDAFPLFEAIYIFNIAKQEEFYRDFTVSDNNEVRANFNELVDALDAKGRMVWATDISPTATTVSSAKATSTSFLPANRVESATTSDALNSFNFIFYLR
ncbi:hypothetical protein HK100_006422 [Physocladia obscura]|uniref:Uncharacterized protein n=1 Tax=Physocladia obscura TaxID=109957 RepID=A0AAD5SQH2_9FUNG|nr:hypothetical protein HK100_006422 [Physocladia obscura]